MTQESITIKEIIKLIERTSVDAPVGVVIKFSHCILEDGPKKAWADLFMECRKIAAKAIELDRKLQTMEPFFFKITDYVQENASKWDTKYLGGSCHDIIIDRCEKLDTHCKDQHEILVIISRDMNMWAKSYAEEKARTIELSKKLKDMTDIAFDKSTELERLKLLLKGQQK